MTETQAIATRTATAADLETARLGPRFGRLDLLSRLSLLAVELLGFDFSTLPPDRVGICLVVRAGSISTDADYWSGRNNPGGPSPLLFTYTLPSSAIGEIAIRHRLTGPVLCLVGGETLALSEGRGFIERGEADAVVSVFCDAITPAAAELCGSAPSSFARATLLRAAATVPPSSGSTP